MPEIEMPIPWQKEFHQDRKPHKKPRPFYCAFPNVDNSCVYHAGLGVWLLREQISEVILKSVCNGSYETPEARVARKIIDSSDHVLELGGGIGAIMSYVILNKEPACYHCFEANPKLLRSIKAAARLNHLSNTRTSLYVYGAVLGRVKRTSASARVKFYVTPNFWGSSTKGIAKGNLSKEIAVESYSLVKFIKQNNITALVCDIEGGEEDLFPDSAGIPASLQKVILEVHPEAMTKLTAEQLLDNLAGNSFELTERLGGQPGQQEVWALRRKRKA